MAKKNTYVPWEEDELNILKEKSGILSAEEIAKMLGRAVSAVRDKQEELGLIKRRKRKAESFEILGYGLRFILIHFAPEGAK